MNQFVNSSHRRVSAGMLATALAAILLTAGCGTDGPPRYHLSGSVTHGGEPIPSGSVMLTPDSSQGNSGPAVSVEIQDGKYDTRREGLGHVGGPHRVTVTALDGQISDEFSAGMPMFPDYEFQFDLPTEDSVQDLDVPADWKRAEPAPNAFMNHGA